MSLQHTTRVSLLALSLLIFKFLQHINSNQLITVTTEVFKVTDWHSALAPHSSVMHAAHIFHSLQYEHTQLQTVDHTSCITCCYLPVFTPVSITLLSTRKETNCSR